MTNKTLVAGNWKMNGHIEDVGVLEILIKQNPAPECDILLCPPATLVAGFAARAARSSLMIGGQNCHQAPKGAYTGEISAKMLRDCGAVAVILGHSERRQMFDESNTIIAQKVTAAWDAGLVSILCVGETADQRNASQTLDIIEEQLNGSVPPPTDDEQDTHERLVIAYEPVWAIGTGLVPTLDQINEVHAFIRKWLSRRFGSKQAPSFRLLYGGSVKPENAADIFQLTDVDGALVGGASLTAKSFQGIIDAAYNS